MNNLKNQLTNIQKRLHLKYGSFSDEYIEQMLCLEYINKDDIVLEIGGNVGRVSLIISSIIDSSNLVVVESDPETCKCLRENRENNNLEFIIVGGAISNVNLYQCGWNVYTLEEINKSDTFKKRVKQIPTIKYDYMREKVNKSFNTLVIDCEGAFYTILKENKSVLDGVEKIIIENDYRNETHKIWVNSYLESQGFITVKSIDLDEQYFNFHKSPLIQKGFYEVKIRQRKIQYNVKDEKGNIYNLKLNLDKDTHINFIPKYTPSFIQIKDSNITKAGKGAFATQKIPKNTFVGIYLGKIQNTYDKIERYTYTSINSKGEQMYINAEDLETSNWTRYINCSTNDEDDNIKSYSCRHPTMYKDNNYNNISFDGCIMLFTKKEINIGEELYVYYGEEYSKTLLQLTNKHITKEHIPKSITSSSFKIAFCFLIIDDINQIDLWKYFFRNMPTHLYNIYIHCKFPEKFNDPFFSKFKIKKYAETKWGLIEDATALLYEEALKDPLNQYFIPLSESTIAVKSFKKMYNILFQNKKQTELKSYIKYWKKDFQEDYNIFSQLYLKQNINPLFQNIKFSNYYKFHSWCILNRKHTEIVANDTFYRECFKNHIASSENYVMYLLSLNDEYKNIENIQITGEDWSDSIVVEDDKYQNRGRRPRTIDNLTFEEAKKYLVNKFIFARKFSKTSNISTYILYN
jgi:FkbM family methyltransferase